MEMWLLLKQLCVDNVLRLNCFFNRLKMNCVPFQAFDKSPQFSSARFKIVHSISIQFGLVEHLEDGQKVDQQAIFLND